MHRLVLNAARSRPGATRCTALRTRHIPSRRLSHSPQTPTPRGRPEGGPNPINAAPASTPTDAPELDQVVIPPQNFSKHTLSSLDFWYRFAKFSLIGLAILSGGTLAALEGTHFWVEHFELAPPPDPDGELERWGWIREAERWTGGARGGTDPALGWKAAHALRSAWISQHWGTGARVLSTNAIAHAQSTNAAIEARLEFSHDFLTVALALATEHEREGKPLRPETVCEILTRKAATLERIGSKGALYDARGAYEHIWDARSGLGTEMEDEACLALKLGDVNARLGDADEARSWWSRALQLVSASDDSHSQSTSDVITAPDTRPALPERLPASPHAQRTVAAVLSSLSAYYAQLGLLADAKAVQDTGIALLAPAPSNTSTFSPSPHESSEIENRQNANSSSASSDNTGTSASPPHTLHELYLQHRISLLALHRAEVTYALRASSPSQTLEELAQAAVEAEHVVHELAFPSTSASSFPSLHQAKLDKTYSASRTLATPASSLLRDARRTALHAWTLSGVLHENAASSSSSSSSFSSSSPPSPSTSLWKKVFSATLPASTSSEKGDAERRAALRCYVRALAWAGAKVDGPESEPEPGPDLLESEWRALWAGYTRTRDAVLASARDGSDKSDSEVKKT